MKNLKFEEAMKELEKIVSALESGELTLDDSFEKFKEGMDLSSYCSKKLNELEKKISVLVQQNDGKMMEAPFDALRGDNNE